MKMIKNALMALMVAAFAVTGFVSCALESDDSTAAGSSSGANTASLSAIYQNSYQGSPSAMPAAVISLTVKDASKLSASGVVGGTTMFSVTDKAYTVTKNNDVYTVTTTTDSGSKLVFNLTIDSENDKVDFTYTLRGVTANLSRKMTDADYVRGTYKGNANIKVSTASKDFADSSFVITKTDDAVVSLKVPSMSYSDTMTFPEYTLTGGTVSASSETYTITFADYTTEADSNGKTTTVSLITASVKDNVLTFSASEKYGKMPFTGTLKFTSTSKE